MKPVSTRLLAYELYFPLAAFAAVSALLVSLRLIEWSAVPAGNLAAVHWHAHEMLFGPFAIGFAGVMLTALPRWTGGAPPRPLVLVLLALPWIAARFAFAAGGADRAALLLSPVAILGLAGYAAFRILAARDARDYGLVALLALFAAADAVFLLHDESLGLRLGFAAAAMIATIMSGRVAPALTRHLAGKHGRTQAAPTPRALETGALVAMLAALAAWSLAPDARATAPLLALAAVALAVRAATWAPGSTLAHPPFLALHVGHLFLPLGLAFQAGAIALADPRLTDAALHAWGTGVFGLMCAAVQASQIRRWSGRALEPSPLADLVMFALGLAVVLRLAALVVQPTRAIAAAAGLAWIIGWVLMLALIARSPRPAAEDETAAPTSDAA